MAKMQADEVRSMGEPILKNGAGVSAGVAATIAILDRLGAPVIEGDATLVTLFISAVIIPLGTWLLARRKTVTVDAANDAIEAAHETHPMQPVPLFEEGA